MKKAFKIFCFTLLLFCAQKTSAQAYYDKGNFLLNLGFGLGYYYAGGTPFLASGEFAVNDVITVGPYFGYTSYRYKFFGERWRYTFIDIGVRGAYHFSKHLDLSTDKLDLYGGASLGYLASNFKEPSGWSGTYSDPYGGTVRFGIFGGARYYFAEKIAGYAELGWGIAPLALGVTFKF